MLAALALAAVAVGCRPQPPAGPETPAGTPLTATAVQPTATTGGASRPPAAADVPTPDPTLEALYAAFQPPVQGDAAAPLLLYEFSDYRCAYCSRFALETAPAIVEQYVAQGLVARVFIDFPIPGHGFPAYVSHEAAHCASEQGRYWDMHHALFAAYERLARVDATDQGTARQVVAEVAAELGLDAEALGSCVASERYRPIVASLAQQAAENGIVMTPTLLLQSEAHTEVISGFVTFHQLQPILDRELARALGTPTASD